MERVARVPLDLRGHLAEQVGVLLADLGEQRAALHAVHAHLADHLVHRHVANVLLLLDELEQVMQLQRKHIIAIEHVRENMDEMQCE